MKRIVLSILIAAPFIAKTQVIDSLNTAKNCLYMKPEEREMIYEINRLRSNPRSYLQYLEPLLKTAKNVLKNFGKGAANYSLTYTTSTSNGKNTKKIDTTWHFTNQEEVKALTTLINDLKKIKKLSV